ncbi:MAG TPA: thioredoxin domain-containing protein [Nocardioides sp.]|uniref:DsbA family protein n=1 Tax=Nocardioides sp. TaxID=35761 RepID=UPI002BCC6594|nr:thioredoxin domain-containing protein [Nocardioides sp.]HTW13943.1 thioredoxin domain-containing protein [Nocardioides sp.]
MSKKKTPRLPAVTPEGKQSQRTRREEMAQLLVDRKRDERRRAIRIQAGIGALVVALVVGITVGVLSTGGEDEPAAVPAGLTESGAVRFGPDDAAVTVRAVEDFQCPACRQFESALGATLAEYRASDDVAVEYVPIAFLDRASTTEYASRALNASMCVLADAGADAWMAMHESLYAQQPSEGGAGLDDRTLASMAVDAGADIDAVGPCITERRYDDWVQEHTDEVMSSGVGSTPTVFVNDEPTQPGDLVAAVDAARS